MEVCYNESPIRIISGPYRATRLWNDIIIHFRNGMPASRHRRYMKVYDNSFSASEAVDWLLNYLRKNPNFGEDVTRLQTIQLLRKLHRARVIEDVRVGKHNKADLVDNGRLFQFTLKSPTKLSRTPFQERKDLINTDQLDPKLRFKPGKGPATPPRLCLSPRSPLDRGSPPQFVCVLRSSPMRNQEMSEPNAINPTAPVPNGSSPQCLQPFPSQNLPQRHRVTSAPLVWAKEDCCNIYQSAPNLASQEKRTLIGEHQVALSSGNLATRPAPSLNIADLWKHVTLNRLQQVLDVDSLEDILDPNFVNGNRILHNCTYLNKSGVVTNIDPKDQLPHWAMSAMKCIAHWPEKIDDNLPTYVGFEKDVFRVVKDYFCNLSEPLMTFEMYEVIINVFTTAEGQEEMKYSLQDILDADDNPDSLTSFESVENLMLNLTNVGSAKKSYCKSTPDDRLYQYTSASTLNLSPIPMATESMVFPPGNEVTMKRSQSSSSIPVAKYETAFGPENRTVTRVYYNDGVSTEFGYSNGPDDFSKTPIETHFESPGSYTNLLPATSQASNAYNVNYAQVRSTSATFTSGRGETNEKKEVKRRYRQSCGSSSDLKTYDNLPPIERRRVQSGGTGLYSNAQAKNMKSRAKPSQVESIQENSPSIFYSLPRQVSSTSTKSSPEFVSSTLPRQKSSTSLKSLHSLPADGTMKSPPEYSSPPHYSKLFPHGYKPSVGGLRKCHRSKSNASLHRIKSVSSVGDDYLNTQSYKDLQMPEEGLFPECMRPRRAAESKESLEGRSLSMSDLLHGDIEKSQGTLKKIHSTASLEDKKTKALQLVCLLLPPANRRKLHLLLKMILKMILNPKLKLSDMHSTRDLVLDTFYRSVLCSPDAAEMEDSLVVKIFDFMIGHSADIMAVPVELKQQVECQLRNMMTQMHYRDQVADDPTSLHFCQQVTVKEFENQKLSNSQRALMDLLDEIIMDKTMQEKNKKKRLKQFAKIYPEIYARRFPPAKGNQDQNTKKPLIKPPLLAKPLMKLRGLRI